MTNLNLSDDEWKKRLSPEQFKILRKKGTERAFTGEYNDCKKDGIYLCAGCGQELFESDAKYDSGSGWPSFYKAAGNDSIEEKDDFSLFSKRVEILCSSCGGHLGHVFPDGPQPTGLRYCVNSASLKLQEKSDEDSPPSN